MTRPDRPRRAIGALLFVLAAGCSGDDARVSDARGGSLPTVPSPTSADPPTPTPTPTDEPATPGSNVAPNVPETIPPTVPPTVPLGAGSVALSEIGSFDSPIAVVPVPGGDGLLLIGERAGRIRVVGPGRDDVVLDIRGRTTTDGERGLLGLAIAPDGDRLYVSSTDGDGTSVLEEYALDDGGAIDADSRRLVIEEPQPYPNHNGGHVAFGPDRLLYYALGDGGAGGDPERRGLDGSTLLGKLLRIDPATSAAGEPYTVPADNPFVGVAGTRPEIWASGLRNPWRFSFDRATGDLWIGDVGQGDVEEIDLATAASGGGRGVSFGWSAFEGTRRFNEDQPAGDHVTPVHEYEHGDAGCSITGGHVYRGAAIPSLVGWYVFGDYCSGRIAAFRPDGSGSGSGDEVVELGRLDDVVTFAEDGDGELIAASLDGEVVRLVPA